MSRRTGEPGADRAAGCSRPGLDLELDGIELELRFLSGEEGVELRARCSPPISEGLRLHRRGDGLVDRMLEGGTERSGDPALDGQVRMSSLRIPEMALLLEPVEEAGRLSLGDGEGSLALTEEERSWER